MGHLSHCLCQATSFPVLLGAHVSERQGRKLKAEVGSHWWVATTSPRRQAGARIPLSTHLPKWIDKRYLLASQWDLSGLRLEWRLFLAS